MPIFDYVCPKCKKKESRIVKFDNMDEQYCSCDKEQKVDRIPSFSTAFILKGSRWYDKGGY